MKSISLLRTAFSTGILLAGISSQAQTYTYERVTDPTSPVTIALELTDDGRIGGWLTDYIHVNGFVDNAGTFTTVKIPNYVEAQVMAINGSTTYGIVNGNTGFSLSAKGSVSIFRPSGYAALPNGANIKGVVVGTTQVAQGNQPAFLLQNGAYQTYLYPNSNVTSFVAINDLNVIAGTWNKTGGPLQSFLLKNGQITPVRFPGAYSTVVTGINNAGEVLGWTQLVAQGPPVMFRFDGTAYTEVPFPPNAYACTPRHVNNLGAFVGTCADNTTKQIFSFVATPMANEPVTLPSQ